LVETLNGIAVADLELALDRSQRALDALRDGRLFLTGGTGFFGRWLLAALARANRTRGLGLRVCVLTRARAAFARACPELAAEPTFEWLEGDVRDFAAPQGAFSHVIHAATDTSAAADARPLELHDSIVLGTRRVLELARAARVPDLLYVSSGAIYGAQGSLERLAETHPGACDPLELGSVYGESKRMAEQLCAVYRQQHGLLPRVARCFAFVGPHLPLAAHFALGNFIADAVAGRPVRIAGDGKPLRSYLYAGDLVVWLLTILIDGAAGRAYNVGSDAGHSLLEVAELVARTVPGSRGIELLGAPSVQRRRVETAVAPHRLRYVPSVERARAELGLEVWTPLPAAIERTASWARTQA
jgi:nucleoside-diphosphate-sugar epimerase